MLIANRLYTKAEFYEFINQPENADKHFELIDAEILETMPSFPIPSNIATWFVIYIGIYLMSNDIAYITDAQGGYDIDDENLFVPDVAVTLKSRLPTLPLSTFVPIPPDIAIEVVSKSDLKDPKNRIERKLKKYLEAGVPLTWYVYYERKVVEVHQPGQPVQIIDIDGVLDGGGVLPGFQLAVKDIFRD
jgi:Uma2 family endonuclease